MTDLEGLATEAWDPAGADLDLRSTDELVRLMNDEDAGVPAAVARAREAIAQAIDTIVERLRAGGRLVYVGAGTSGRLALVDAAECESTFAIPPGRVVALIAGGPTSAATAQEHAEDDREAGVTAIRELGVVGSDVVVALSASGRTPFTLGAVEEARRLGAATVAVVSTEESALGEAADHEITVLVGPELVAGSTRLKSGTAQKLVLNMLSTIAMVRLGKTFGNLMVDVVATNEKLRSRVRRIVALASGAEPERVELALDAADGDAKVAIVSLLADVDATTARARLDAAGGVVREALLP